MKSINNLIQIEIGETWEMKKANGEIIQFKLIGLDTKQTLLTVQVNSYPITISSLNELSGQHGYTELYFVSSQINFCEE